MIIFPCEFLSAFLCHSLLPLEMVSCYGNYLFKPMTYIANILVGINFRFSKRVQMSCRIESPNEAIYNIECDLLQFSVSF